MPTVCDPRWLGFATLYFVLYICCLSAHRVVIIPIHHSLQNLYLREPSAIFFPFWSTRISLPTKIRILSTCPHFDVSTEACILRICVTKSSNASQSAGVYTIDTPSIHAPLTDSAGTRFRKRRCWWATLVADMATNILGTCTTRKDLECSQTLATKLSPSHRSGCDSCSRPHRPTTA